MTTVPDSPIVSVVSVVYNTGKYVLDGFDSLLSQTYAQEAIQHIIVDDASTDDSVSLIRDWLDAHPQHQATLMVHPHNKGLCAALNTGLSVAHGSYYAVMADDIWRPAKLEVMVAALQAAPDTIAMAYTAYDICDEHGLVYQTHLKPSKPKPTTDPFINLIVVGLDIHAVTTMYRITALRAIGGYNELLGFEDVDAYLKLYNLGYTFLYIDQPLTIYRKSRSQSQSMSDRHRRDYKLVKDFIQMNPSHYGHSLERDRVNTDFLEDALEIYFLSTYGRPHSGGGTDYHTIWTPFLFRIYKEQHRWKDYCRLLFRLYFRKKYSPYTLRDIIFLFRAYFNKNHQYI